MTQEQMAAALSAVAAEMQCTINSVSNWERGNTEIKAADLARFAKACDTTPAALLENL